MEGLGVSIMRRLFSAAVVIGMLLPTVVQAAPLGLILNDSPDITSVFMDVSYNAGSQSLAANGFSATLDDDGVGPALDFDNFGTFDILASIDNSGAPLGGSLTITGDLTSTLGLSGTLLTGTLTDFGWFGTTRDGFEFLFQVTGGLLATAQYYGLPGSSVGVIYDSGEDVFNGTFVSSFSSSGFGSGFSDSAPIPEPTTLAFLFAAAFLSRRPKNR